MLCSHVIPKQPSTKITHLSLGTWQAATGQEGLFSLVHAGDSCDCATVEQVPQCLMYRLMRMCHSCACAGAARVRPDALALREYHCCLRFATCHRKQLISTATSAAFCITSDAVLRKQSCVEQRVLSQILCCCMQLQRFATCMKPTLVRPETRPRSTRNLPWNSLSCRSVTAGSGAQ